jgi:hypothetical protein
MYQTLLRGNPVVAAAIATGLCAAITVVSYVAFEPVVSMAQDSDTFTVRQQITAEVSIEAAAADVTMSPNIQGISGGISSGTTTVTVATSDPDGYELSIRFADNIAMQAEGSASYIENYDDGGTADYNFAVAGGESAFALSASSTSVVSELLNNGSACGSGTAHAGHCWTMEANASTTAFKLVDRTSSTAGEQTTIAFRVGVGANPIPSVPAGFYNATATLTAIVQP